MKQCEKCKMFFGNNGALVLHIKKCNEDEELILKIKNDYLGGYSILELSKKYQIKPQKIGRIIGKENIRNLSESIKIARKKYPVKISIETKKKISDSLKRAHKKGNHPGWSHINLDKNRRSYPEKFFIRVIKENKLDEKYTFIEKMPYRRYFLDFVIVELKVDIEIDGQQHFRKNDIIHDQKRDLFLINDGWKVYRIAWFELCNNPKNEIQKLINYIENENKQQLIKYDITQIIASKKQNKFGTKNEYIEKIRIKNYKELHEPRINLILKSDIDFSKFGWVNKVSKLINITPQRINEWMKKYMLDFYNGKCFKKKL